MKEAFVVLSILLSSMATGFSISSESNVELLGFVYKSFLANDLWDCFVKCLEERVCQSINFNLISMACEYNKEVKRRTTDIRQKSLKVYMENPKRAKKGSLPFLAARSCKAINDVGESQGDGEYWVDPAHTGDPFTVYCDMTTDSGGWTLIKRTKLQTTNPGKDRIDMNDYRGITNYTNSKVYVLIPALQELRRLIEFQQIRWRCHKKSVGRTLDIMTTNDSAGFSVLSHFLDIPNLQPSACNSFTRLPDDNSVLAQNCNKWGNTGSQVEVNRWGRYSNDGRWRIYNNAILWETKYYFTVVAPNYFCDDFTGNLGALSVGDEWEIFVR